MITLAQRNESTHTDTLLPLMESASECDNPTDMHTVWRMQRKSLFLDPVASSKMKAKHLLCVLLQLQCVFLNT